MSWIAFLLVVIAALVDCWWLALIICFCSAVSE